MENSEPIESSGAYSGIPNWIMRAGMRYEANDIIVTPPSSEDEGFFHLRYGRSEERRSSTYDRINQELGVTLQVENGEPMIKGVCSADSSGNTTPLASLLVDNNTSHLEATASHTNTIPASASVSLGASPTHTPDYAPLQALTEEKRSISLEFSRRDQEVFPVRKTPVTVAPTIDVQSDNPSTNEEGALCAPHAPSTPQTPLSAVVGDFLKGMHNASVSASHEEFESITQKENLLGKDAEAKDFVDRVRKISSNLLVYPMISESVGEKSDNSTPFVTPLSTPHSSPLSRRKVQNMVMEKTNTHSYFYTKLVGAQSSEAQVPPSSGEASTSLASRTQQLEDRSQEGHVLEACTKTVGLKKRARPKASSLREMNFWAPTSM